MSTVAYTLDKENRGDHARLTVLVVEDFDEIRFMTRVMLEVSGYCVVEAINGLEAIEVAQRERPDLVLMDLNLPRLDGFAATRRIRELSELRGVPIVAVTAYGTAEHRSRAIASGCDEFITKPINFVQLKELLGCLLRPDKAVA